MTMLRDIDAFYESKEEGLRDCLLALRDFILAFDEGIAHVWKYRMPMFTFKDKMLCYLWVDKKTKNPYIGIVKGDQIEHPLLVKGDRSKMKILPVALGEDLPIDIISSILKTAISLY